MRKLPVNLTSSTRLQRSSVSSVRGTRSAPRASAALFTRISMRLNSANASDATRRASAPDDASAVRGRHRRPRLRTCALYPERLLHAAGEQEDFRPLFLPGPPALVLWSGAVPRGLSQSNVRQNATVCI